jgi:predicted TIM-barrel fold metal-dependent hydrolase
MIDASAYTGNWPFRPLPGSTPEDLLGLLNAEGIEQALVSPIEGIFYDEPQLANEKLCESLRDFPSLVPAAVLNPKLSNWRRNLDICCEEYHVRAVKLYPNYHHYDLDGDDAVALLKAAGERGIPVIVQMRVQDVRAHNPLVSMPDVDIVDAIKAARAHPDTRFVIGAIRWGEANSKAKEIMELSNLWIDISHVEYTDGLRRIIQIYGLRQLLFGTHAPFFVVRSAILKLREAELSEEERNAITRGNASAILRV